MWIVFLSFVCVIENEEYSNDISTIFTTYESAYSQYVDLRNDLDPDCYVDSQTIEYQEQDYPEDPGKDYIKDKIS